MTITIYATTNLCLTEGTAWPPSPFPFPSIQPHSPATASPNAFLAVESVR